MKKLTDKQIEAAYARLKIENVKLYNECIRVGTDVHDAIAQRKSAARVAAIAEQGAMLLCLQLLDAKR